MLWRSVQKFILRYMDGNGTTGDAQPPFLTFVKPAEVCLWHFGFNTSSLYLALFQQSRYVLFYHEAPFKLFLRVRGSKELNIHSYKKKDWSNVDKLRVIVKLGFLF